MKSSSRQSAAGAKPLRTLEQTVFLQIQKTADALMGELADLLKPAGLSPTQYNVLRVLRAAGADGMPCGRIAERMLTREPDITRLLDRLQKRGLIARGRDPRDRRVVLGRIAAKGLKMLERLDEPVLELHRSQLRHLGGGRLRELADLLQNARRRTP